MSVPNPHLAEEATAPLAAPQAAHAETPWLTWCNAVIDHAFGFDLRDEELRQLLGSDPRR